MLDKEITERIALLIVWARHSKPGDDHNSAPYDLTHKRILEIANELDGWLTTNYESKIE